jgi:hypothetical protein
LIAAAANTPENRDAAVAILTSDPKTSSNAIVTGLWSLGLIAAVENGQVDEDNVKFVQSIYGVYVPGGNRTICCSRAPIGKADCRERKQALWNAMKNVK